MPRHATISLVAFRYFPHDEEDHFAKTLGRMGDCVDAAAELGSDLVAFPEICSRAGARESWVFEELDGPTLTAMAKKAAERGIYVVCPVALMDGDKRRNGSVLLDRAGAIAGVYYKNVPTHGELNLGVVPGTETPVFETDFGRVGLSICFDLNYWEVGHSLCENRAELVIWSSMWTGTRMMSRWSIEFGFTMAGIHCGDASFVDLAGRPIVNARRTTANIGGAVPLTTATLDLDRRLLHHNGNVGRLPPLFEKYGAGAIHAEHLGTECQLVIGSNLPDVPTDRMIEEFGLEPMRDYLARVRRDRQRMLDGAYEAP